MLPLLLATVLAFARYAFAINFPYEEVQLQQSEIGDNPDIAFGNRTSTEKPPCKAFPGYEVWPSEERWAAFNISLGGSLIKGIPPAAACYDGEYRDAARCSVVRRGFSNALFA